MATNKLINPIDDLPPLQNFIELIGALEAYESNDYAKLALKELRHGAELHRKELIEVIRDQEMVFKQALHHPTPHYDLKGMEKALGKESKALEVLLGEHVPDSKLTELHKTHSGAASVAQALVELAHGIADDAVKAVANKVKKSLDGLKQAQARVEAGGHVAFDDKVSKVARRLWVALDTGYDVFGICLRQEGIAYDPILAGRPTTRTSLRPSVSLHDPNEVNSKKGGRPKGSNKDKKPPAGGTTETAGGVSAGGKPTA